MFFNNIDFKIKKSFYLKITFIEFFYNINFGINIKIQILINITMAFKK